MRMAEQSFQVSLMHLWLTLQLHLGGIIVFHGENRSTEKTALVRFTYPLNNDISLEGMDIRSVKRQASALKFWRLGWWSGMDLGPILSVTMYSNASGNASVNAAADPGFVRLALASETESVWCSGAESRKWIGNGPCPLTFPGSFLGFNIQIYAFLHLLEALFLSFLTAISTPKTDKNRKLDCTSIWDIVCTASTFNLCEKVLLLILWLEEVCQEKWRMKIAWYEWWQIA